MNKMSIKSYTINVERNVAGPHLPVCFPAAIEQISPYSYRPKIYTEYKEFVDYLDTLSIDEFKSTSTITEYESVIDSLVRPLGGLAINDLVMKSIKTPLGLKRAINELINEDYRIVLDIKYGSVSKDRAVHSVGLIPVERDYVTLVSTHIPKDLRGIISLSKLATRLAVSNEPYLSNHPLRNANLVAFPNI
jgi:hypothetical protein